jgi:glycolate oxidase FAD binding subunit
MQPKTEQELADLILSANQPLNIQGGGTRGISCVGQPLSTKGFSGISLYHPGALTMVAGTGTPLADIRAALDAENQMLPFEPYEMGHLTGVKQGSTIGGAFSTNASGARRLQVGAARDFLLGVRFVDGTGRIVKNGGRVMKNVTGYDLVKLLAGSHGTLGVITEVSFKVLPKPSSVRHLTAKDISAAVAVNLMTAASMTPYDISGAWFDLATSKATIRIEGFEQSVAYRAEMLSKQLSKIAALNDDVADDTVRFLTDDSPGDVWRISCKPTEAALLSDRLGTMDQLFDWAGGRIWARVPNGTDVRSKIADYSAVATLMYADPETVSQLGRFDPEPAGVARLSQGLRRKFDPRGILNKGLMD